MPAHLLDTSATYKRLDPSGLRDRIAGLPDQAQEAWEAALSTNLPKTYVHVEKVVLAGLGGSAIGGDLVRDIAALEDGPFITVVRDYTLPHWVGDDTLVIASSYSGNTEETLSSFENALRRGCRILVATSGGRLKELAERHSLPMVEIEFVGEPRSAVGYSLMGPLGIMAKLGLVEDKSGNVAEALEAARDQGDKLAPTVPLDKNPAKQLALKLQGKLPVIWGSGILTATANRWKTQLNENAKVWSFAEVLPEAHHNTVVGFPLPKAVKDLGMMVLLKPRLVHPRIALRYTISEEMLKREGVAYTTVEAREGSPLTQVLTTVQLGDWTSYYLAMLNDVDPNPVKVIDWLRARLLQE